jgi:hypothetical protein
MPEFQNFNSERRHYTTAHLVASTILPSRHAVLILLALDAWAGQNLASGPGDGAPPSSIPGGLGLMAPT